MKQKLFMCMTQTGHMTHIIISQTSQKIVTSKHIKCDFLAENGLIETKKMFFCEENGACSPKRHIHTHISHMNKQQHWNHTLIQAMSDQW